MHEKQNILAPQPCLHTLMQTLLSPNQSVRTILVILLSAVLPKTNIKSMKLNIQQEKLTPSPDEDQLYIVKTLR